MTKDIMLNYKLSLYRTFKTKTAPECFIEPNQNTKWIKQSQCVSENVMLVISANFGVFLFILSCKNWAGIT